MASEEVRAELYRRVSEIKEGDKAYLFIVSGSSVRKINAGFDAIELLGMLDWNRDDVMRQIRGEIRPNIIDRTVLETGSQESK